MDLVGNLVEKFGTARGEQQDGAFLSESHCQGTADPAGRPGE
jgi:hypothetical protein